MSHRTSPMATMRSGAISCKYRLEIHEQSAVTGLLLSAVDRRESIPFSWPAQVSNDPLKAQQSADQLKLAFLTSPVGVCRLPPQRTIGEDWSYLSIQISGEASFMRRDYWPSGLLSIRAKILLAVLLICAGPAFAQSDHWVTSWTTAQQLVGSNVPAGGGPQRGGRGGGPATNLPPSFSDETLRQIAHVSLGGRRIRVELSNMINAG